MSRSGYIDDYDEDGIGGLWCGVVMRVICGKCGQEVFWEIVVVLDVMFMKVFVVEFLVMEEGEFCILGVFGNVCGMDMLCIDFDDWEVVVVVFGIVLLMVCEIVYWNDEGIDLY